MMPEQLRRQYSVVINDFLGPKLAKDLFEILDRPDFKTVILSEPKAVVEEFTEEQKIVLPLLKQIYNAIVKWLSLYSDFVKNTFSLYDEVQKVTSYRRVDTFEAKEYKEKDAELQQFKDALEYLSQTMQQLANTNVQTQEVRPLSTYFMNSGNISDYISNAVNNEEIPQDYKDALSKLGEQQIEKCKG